MYRSVSLDAALKADDRFIKSSDGMCGLGAVVKKLCHSNLGTKHRYEPNLSWRVSD